MTQVRSQSPSITRYREGNILLFSDLRRENINAGNKYRGHGSPTIVAEIRENRELSKRPEIKIPF
jgi:hypothetical protein